MSNVEELWAEYEDDVGLEPEERPTDAEVEAAEKDRSPHWFWECVLRTRNMTVWRHRPVEGAPPEARLRAARALGPNDTKYRIISNGRGIPALLNWLKSVGLHRPPDTSDCVNVGELPYLLTPAEVAAILRTTLTAIYARVERGGMPGVVRQGRKLLFHRDVLLRTLDRLGKGGGK